jgi:hypothetical protein
VPSELKSCVFINCFDAIHQLGMFILNCKALKSSAGYRQSGLQSRPTNPQKDVLYPKPSPVKINLAIFIHEILNLGLR